MRGPLFVAMLLCVIATSISITVSTLSTGITPTQTRTHRCEPTVEVSPIEPSLATIHLDESLVPDELKQCYGMPVLRKALAELLKAARAKPGQLVKRDLLGFDQAQLFGKQLVVSSSDSAPAIVVELDSPRGSTVIKIHIIEIN